jgi:hypothetical protein
MMSNGRRFDCYVSARTIYVAIPLYSSIRACCREYVGEIYELQYYYHPPIIFLSSFSFSFHFFILFLFFTLLYTNYHL